jgi:hypothetical protein
MINPENQLICMKHAEYHLLWLLFLHVSAVKYCRFDCLDEVAMKLECFYGQLLGSGDVCQVQ